MEISKRLIIVLIMGLVTISPAISAEPELSNTTAASCLLKITSDPAILPLEEDIVEYLLRSSGVASKAARDVLNTNFNNDYLEIEWLAYEEGMTNPPAVNDPYQNERTPEGMQSNNENYQMILMHIAVFLKSDDIPAAREFMNALIDNLRTALNSAFDEYRNKLNSRLQLAEEESARAESEVRSIQERLNEISNSTILDKDRILEDISNMRRELKTIEMNQRSDRIIVENITRQIAETQAKSKEKVENDEVVNELVKLLMSQEQLLTNTEKQLEAGRALSDQFADLKEKITKTRIDLAQRREELSKSAGGNRIEALNNKMADHLLQFALNQQKTRDLSQQIDHSQELLSKADDYELLSLKLDIAKQNLKEAILWRDRMSRQIRILQPPAVSVIGGN